VHDLCYSKLFRVQVREKLNWSRQNEKKFESTYFGHVYTMTKEREKKNRNEIDSKRGEVQWYETFLLLVSLLFFLFYYHSITFLMDIIIKREEKKSNFITSYVKFISLKGHFNTCKISQGEKCLPIIRSCKTFITVKFCIEKINFFFHIISTN